ncbi:MAG: zinc-ribbon domain-containing protein [Clostridiales bacterium]|nr:zinc-ribbon domain-containing protein [Clostridiales bacterium]
MFCRKCGTQLSDDSRFCYNCGEPTYLAEQKDSITPEVEDDYDPFAPLVPPTTNNTQTPPPPQPKPQAQNAPTSAAENGVFGLLGFIFSFFSPILGLIFSIIGLNRKKNHGLAKAGLILSIVFIALYVLIFIIVMTQIASTPYYYYHYYY